MSNLIGSILRAATREKDEPLNILTFPSHESYESNLACTQHNFYAYRVLDGSIKDWNEVYRKLPNNYSLLNPHLGPNQIPAYLDLDLVFSQNRWGQFPVAYKLSKSLGLPLITLEHTLPLLQWGPNELKTFKQMKGDINVFISNFSREKWLWGEDEAVVINHGIDTNLFKPLKGIQKEKKILSVVNDWINRADILGFPLYRQVTEGLPVCPVGKTPGFSEPAKNVNDLVGYYNTCQVFINTSIVSPIPMSLLESMACACCPISTATCMIPEIIQNGVNGFITNDPYQMRKYLIDCLNDPQLCQEIGENARKTIINDFSLLKFVENWNEVFYKAANLNRKCVAHENKFIDRAT
jgi:glycosyltransferase involved in cell wall biosynthesis